MHVGNHKPSHSATPQAVDATPPPPIDVPSIPLDELEKMTHNFDSKALVGEGSYGRVYYAVLDDGSEVALKKLDVSSEHESNNKFLTQVCPLFLVNRYHSHLKLDIEDITGFSCFKVET